MAKRSSTHRQGRPGQPLAVAAPAIVLGAIQCRRARGIKTHGAILQRAVNLASLEGLEGLTIGKLATSLKISKSGLFAHFGSKEDFQCAGGQGRGGLFVETVIRPAFEAQGLARLRALCAHWLGYAEANS